MRNFLTIFKREFTAYFNTPTAYVYLIIFLLMNTGLFMSSFFLEGNASMRSFFGFLPFFLAVFIPAISMRLWSEERKLGTLSLLLGFPMTASALTLGKFFASFIFYALALAGTVTIPIMISLVGSPDMGAIIGGYLGALLLGGFFLAIGIFISAFFKDQIVTLILSIVVCFSVYMLGSDFLAVFIDGWVQGLGELLKNGLGAAGHYSTFERGLVDLRGIAYFVVGSGILLWLNTLTLESLIRRKPRGRFALSVVFLLLIGVAVNLVMSETRVGRLDLTEGKQYTMSEATKRILSRLQAPVQVNYYVSPKEKLPSVMKNLQRDVEDQLSDLARINNKFVFSIYNPLADPSKLEELDKKGVKPFQAQSIEKDSMDIKNVYSSITISYLDKKTETIPQIVPQMLGRLEYDLMSKIYRMTLDEQPTVAMLAPIDPVSPQYQDPRMREFLMKMGQKVPEETDNYSKIMEYLRHEGYGVARIKLDKREIIPKDAKSLLIFDPRMLNERQKYEISRFLAQGGNVFVCAQKFRFQYQPGAQGMINVIPKIAPNNIDELIGHYGVTINPKILMDANSEPITIQIPQRVAGLMQTMVSAKVDFPVQIRIPAEDLNPDLPITNRIVGLLYVWGSALKLDGDKLKQSGLKVETIFSSGKHSWFADYANAPLSPAQMDKDTNPSQGPQPLAIRVSGLFPDFYEGKEIPQWEQSDGEDKGQPVEKKMAPAIERKPGKLVVVANSDMFSDQVLGFLNNSLLMLNTVDSLTLGDDLISIRSKFQTGRLIRDLSPAQKLFYRFFTTALAPLILIIFGAARLIIRRRRREQYLKTVSEAA